MKKLNLFFILIIIPLLAVINGCNYKQKKEEERKRKEEQEYLLKRAVKITAYREIESGIIDLYLISFKIINNTTKDLRYIEWETTFYNDFGDYIGTQRFSFNAKNKAEVLKSGYQIKLSWGLPDIVFKKCPDNYTTEIDKIEIKLADNNKTIDYNSIFWQDIDDIPVSKLAIDAFKDDIKYLKSIFK